MHSYADEKRQALQLWADHITRIVDGDAAAGQRRLDGTLTLPHLGQNPHNYFLHRGAEATSGPPDNIWWHGEL